MNIRFSVTMRFLLSVSELQDQMGQTEGQTADSLQCAIVLGGLHNKFSTYRPAGTLFNSIDLPRPIVLLIQRLRRRITL